MGRYIVKRLLMMIPVLLGISLIVFLMLHFTPGDPARAILGDTATQEEVEALRVELGLDQPLITQYLRYMFNLIFRLDMGTSYVSHRPVFSEILVRFPNTIILTAVITIKLSIAFFMMFSLQMARSFLKELSGARYT